VTTDKIFQYKGVLRTSRVFKIGGKFKKNPVLYDIPILSDGVICLIDHKAAKQRRDKVSSYFSKAQSRKLESTIIQPKCEKFFARLANATTSVNLSYAFRALTADIVSDYGINLDLKALDVHDFQAPVMVAMNNFTDMFYFSMYFKSFFNGFYFFMRKRSDAFVKAIVPDLFEMFSFRRVIFFIIGREL